MKQNHSSRLTPLARPTTAPKKPGVVVQLKTKRRDLITQPKTEPKTSANQGPTTSDRGTLRPSVGSRPPTTNAAPPKKNTAQKPRKLPYVSQRELVDQYYDMLDGESDAKWEMDAPRRERAAALAAKKARPKKALTEDARFHLEQQEKAIKQRAAAKAELELKQAEAEIAEAKYNFTLEIVKAQKKAKAPERLTTSGRDYREAILVLGTWGGQIEAHTIMKNLGLKAVIVHLEGQKLVQLCDIGDFKQAPSGLVLWWSDQTHYKIVDCTGGKQPSPDQVIFDPKPQGDCLYEALAFIDAWHKQNDHSPLGLTTLCQTFLNLKAPQRIDKIAAMRLIAYLHIETSMANAAATDPQHEADAKSDPMVQKAMVLEAAYALLAPSKWWVKTDGHGSFKLLPRQSNAKVEQELSIERIETQLRKTYGKRFSLEVKPSGKGGLFLATSTLSWLAQTLSLEPSYSEQGLLAAAKPKDLSQNGQNGQNGIELRTHVVALEDTYVTEETLAAFIETTGRLECSTEVILKAIRKMDSAEPSRNNKLKLVENKGLMSKPDLARLENLRAGVHCSEGIKPNGCTLFFSKGEPRVLIGIGYHEAPKQNKTTYFVTWSSEGLTGKFWLS